MLEIFRLLQKRFPNLITQIALTNIDVGKDRPEINPLSWNFKSCTIKTYSER